MHAVDDLVELPAACYVTEVSHAHDGRAYAFGGGLYIDPVFPPYQVRALVADRPGLDDARLLDATIPPPEAIDYYGQLDPAPGRRRGRARPSSSASAIQAFVTRAYVVGVAGAGAGSRRASPASGRATDGRRNGRCERTDRHAAGPARRRGQGVRRDRRAGAGRPRGRRRRDRRRGRRQRRREVDADQAHRRRPPAHARPLLLDGEPVRLAKPERLARATGSRSCSRTSRSSTTSRST